MVGTVKSQTGEPRPVALLLGLGYCARAIIPHLKQAGYKIIATAQDTEKHQTLAKSEDILLLPFAGALRRDVSQAFNEADIVLSSIPPAEYRDPVISLREAGPLFPQAKWIGYLSATSVYGDRGGQWVFEDEKLYPTTDRGRYRVEAELAWLESEGPVHIFRLAGIYGPDIMGLSRNPFARLRSGRARAVLKPGHVVNRIHVADIATAVLASIKRPDPTTIYNLSDGQPAPPQDVLNYAANLLKVPSPKHVSHHDASLSDMARSFYTETKRISNKRARTNLNWQPAFPNYKIGLKAILDGEGRK